MNERFWCVEKFFMEYLVKRNVEQVIIRYVHIVTLLSCLLLTCRMGSMWKRRTSHFIISIENAVMGFLNWLQDERRSSASTRNQRYAAIRSFFRFMICGGPKAYVTMERHLYHTAKKGFTRKSISYLTIDAVKYLLNKYPKTQTRAKGYDMVAQCIYFWEHGYNHWFNPESVRTSKPYAVKLLGKGTKEELFQ